MTLCLCDVILGCCLRRRTPMFQREDRLPDPGKAIGRSIAPVPMTPRVLPDRSVPGARWGWMRVRLGSRAKACSATATLP